MIQIRRELVDRGIKTDPLPVQADLIPSVIVKGIIMQSDPGGDCGGDIEAAGKGRKEGRMFVAS